MPVSTPRAVLRVANSVTERVKPGQSASTMVPTSAVPNTHNAAPKSVATKPQAGGSVGAMCLSVPAMCAPGAISGGLGPRKVKLPWMTAAGPTSSVLLVTSTFPATLALMTVLPAATVK